MKMRNMLLSLLALTMVLGANVRAEEGHEGGDKTNMVALDKLPKEVVTAATKAVEGVKLVSATTEKAEKGVVYVILGKAGDKNWTIRVTVDADGKVTNTEAKAADEKKAEGDKK